MSILYSEDKNFMMILTPISFDGDFYSCKVVVESTIFSLNFEKTKLVRVSIKNIEYIKNNLKNLDNVNNIRVEGEELISFYPIDMFMNIDVFYSNQNFSNVLIRFIMGVYSNSMINDFNLCIEISIPTSRIKDFFVDFIKESESLLISKL